MPNLAGRVDTVSYVLKRIRKDIRKDPAVPCRAPPGLLEDSPPPYESIDSSPTCTENDFSRFAVNASLAAIVEAGEARYS